jgi:hypothetical protein
MMGLSAKRSLKYVMDELRRQKTHEERPVKHQLVDSEAYWTLVGLLQDSFSQPKKYHIELLHNYFEEEHPEAWYEKLYESMKTSIAASEKPKTHEIAIGNDVILCGKPFIVEGDTVIHLVRSNTFQGLQEEHKVMIMCYMKLCNVKKGILRESCGIETRDTPVAWDSHIWKQVKRTILSCIKLL